MDAGQPLLQPYWMGELEPGQPDRESTLYPFARNRRSIAAEGEVL
jgi:hypothetical protein